MNPVIIKVGPLEVHAFTAWIAAGVSIGIIIVLGIAAYRQQRLTAWLDALIGAVVGGVIGARLVHVWLNWNYFSEHTEQITNLSNGGLDWHGAVIFGTAGLLIVALMRRVPIGELTDALALAFPIGAAAGWLACSVANTGYGIEVRTLADFPGRLVIESADIYGNVAPRLNLPPIGVAVAVLVLVIVALMTAFKVFSGVRLWLAIALFSLGTGLIDFFRAESVPLWFGHRADQILDYALAIGAVILVDMTVIGRHRVVRAMSRAGRDSNEAVSKGA